MLILLPTNYFYASLLHSVKHDFFYFFLVGLDFLSKTCKSTAKMVKGTNSLADGVWHKICHLILPTNLCPALLVHATGEKGSYKMMVK